MQDQRVNNADILTGRRIWVTAERRAGHQKRYLDARGATVLMAPLMETVDDTGCTDVGAVSERLIDRPPEIFIVQTGQGISWWMERLTQDQQDRLTTSLCTSTVWSRGAKSTSRCRSLGLDVSWQAPDETAREVAERCRSLTPGTRVAVQLVGTVHDVIVDALEAVDADIEYMRIYRYRIPADTSAALELIDATITGDIDAITFTASPAISHLREIASRAGLIGDLDNALRSACVPVVVGPVCAATAVDAGWTGIIEPDVARLIPMLDALTAALGAPSSTRGPTR